MMIDARCTCPTRPVRRVHLSPDPAASVTDTVTRDASKGPIRRYE
ncbi:hypothetical protein GO615_12235 [Aromatoleum evansii]|nr:hypothetical protein [Aromatoleum evansii]